MTQYDGQPNGQRENEVLDAERTLSEADNVGYASTMAMEPVPQVADLNQTDERAATVMMDTSSIHNLDELWDDEEDLANASTMAVGFESLEESSREAPRRTAVEPPDKVQAMLSQANELAKQLSGQQPGLSNGGVAPTMAERAVPPPNEATVRGVPTGEIGQANNTSKLLMIAIGVVTLMILAGLGFLVFMLV